MTQHQFTVADHIQLAVFSITPSASAVMPLERKVDEWIEANEMGGFAKEEFRWHYLGARIVGYEAPTYIFYNDLDAMQFRLTWGEDFDYQAC
jgi:hypothetical protein